MVTFWPKKECSRYPWRVWLEAGWRQADQQALGRQWDGSKGRGIGTHPSSYEPLCANRRCGSRSPNGRVMRLPCGCLPRSTFLPSATQISGEGRGFHCRVPRARRVNSFRPPLSPLSLLLLSMPVGWRRRPSVTPLSCLRKVRLTLLGGICIYLWAVCPQSALRRRTSLFGLAVGEIVSRRG